VLGEHRSKHAGDNVSKFGPVNIRFPRGRLRNRIGAWMASCLPITRDELATLES
jgi:hypothetical protein